MLSDFETFNIDELNTPTELLLSITDEGRKLDKNHIDQMIKTSVLKQVLKAMGGKLHVHSLYAKTTFYVTLPCKS